MPFHLLKLYNVDREGILNVEFGRMHMEAAAVYCKVLFQNLHAETEGKHVIPQSIAGRKGED
jgi:hypothetical protein